MSKKNIINNTSCNIDEKEIKAAISKIERYTPLAQNNNRLFESGISINISGNYNDNSFKRSTLFNSYICAKFTNSAFTSSYFSKVNIKNTTFSESNFQYCNLVECEIHNTDYLSTNLSYSYFHDSILNSVQFKGSTVSEITFEHCTFKDCIFTSSMLENTVFLNCKLINVQFLNANIEYMEFRDCIVESVSMSFSQIPYVFNAMKYVQENKIHILTDNDKISCSEYLALKNDLIAYYMSIEEYFPLVNIYSSEYDVDMTYQCLISGINKSVINRNFRMLKFFCKAAVSGSLFDYDTLRKLYYSIESFIKKENLNASEKRNFIYNIGEIRSILLDNIYGMPTARIVLHTNIDSSESSKVIQFIQFLDFTITTMCTKKISRIEYSHNSDANFVTVLSANYAEILLVIGVLFSFANNITKQIQERILSKQQIKLNSLEIQQKEQELQKQIIIKEKDEELKSQGISYNLQYIVDNTTTNQDINIFL